MTHLLVTAMPFAGHVRPMTAVAGALLDRGHRVTAYTGAEYADAFDELGCEVVLWKDARDFDEHRISETFPAVGLPGRLGDLANLRDLFIGTAPGQVEDIVAAHERTPFDAIVGDVLAVGSGLAAEVLELPWATVSLVPLTLRSQDLPPSGLALQPGQTWLSRVRDAALRAMVPTAKEPIEQAYRAARKATGLGPGKPFDQAIYAERLVLATGSPQLEFPRSDLPDSVEFVGILEPRIRPMGSLPLWAETLADEPRPVVLVTQGTFDTDPEELLQPALDGLATDHVRIIATTAGRDVGDRVPPNARLVDFIALGPILGHVRVGVTNGGWGGVLEMLAHGVPLVVAGSHLDKPEVAARVAWSGAGIDLRTGHPRPIRLRNAVRQVIREPSFRERALEIAEEFRRLGGARRAAESIENVLLAG
ncbi:glycosyltransferase [Agrococcus sp. ProA11]|uniref:glycosyltransferase n=1 Tax=Agrococcus chionoecetis TaxID=3153752 RepID=UPI003260EE2B